MQQVGWAYRDKRWNNSERWHVCGMTKPQECKGRDIEPVYIVSNGPECTICGAETERRSFDDTQYICEKVECNAAYTNTDAFNFVEHVRQMLGAGYGMGHQTADLFRVLKARNEQWEIWAKRYVVPDSSYEIERKPLVVVTAALAAAISLLERTPNAKSAAMSDTAFDIMLSDYNKALNYARSFINAGGS
jgi:hypothetical protein